MKRFWLAALGALLACGPGASEGPADGSAVDGGKPTVITPVVKPPDPAAYSTRVAGDWPVQQKRVAIVELSIDPADLARLEANPTSDELVAATFALDGVAAKAHVRYRGASTRTLPQKSFKVELDPGFDLENRDHFELLAEYTDGGKLEEKVAIDLLQALGVEAPDGRYVNLRVNGKPYGLYLDMEHVGREFLRAHHFEADASVYRCGGRNCEMKSAPAGSYQQDFEKKTNETSSWGDLQALLALIDRSDDPEFERRICERIDFDRYLSNLAADALISNIIVEDSRSYWVHELGRDLWTYAPWDLNNAWMTYNRFWKVTDPPITTRDVRVFSAYDPFVERTWNERKGDPAYRPTWSVLNTRIWDRPALRARLIGKIQGALDGVFREDRAVTEVHSVWAAAGKDILADPYIDGAFANNAVSYLERYIRDRRTYVLANLDQARHHGEGPLVVNELHFADGNGPGYVELYNRGTTDLDLAGKVLTNDLRQPFRYVLPAGLVVPARGYLKLWADGVNDEEHLPFTLDPSGGEVGVFDGTHVWGPLDVVYYGPHAPGSSYGRLTDGAEDFGVLSPSPGVANR